MSKRTRLSLVDYSDPLFEDCDSSDEDYMPSSDSEEEDQDNGKINPFNWSRERILLPHLESVIKQGDLNSIHFELITKQLHDDSDDECEENWQKPTTIL